MGQYNCELGKFNVAYFPVMDLGRTNALLAQLGFLLDQKEPRTIQEAFHMAIEIEANISLPKEEHLSTP
jgi:hypothetical protein